MRRKRLARLNKFEQRFPDTNGELQYATELQKQWRGRGSDERWVLLLNVQAGLFIFNTI